MSEITAINLYGQGHIRGERDYDISYEGSFGCREDGRYVLVTPMASGVKGMRGILSSRTMEEVAYRAFVNLELLGVNAGMFIDNLVLFSDFRADGKDREYRFRRRRILHGCWRFPLNDEQLGEFRRFLGDARRGGMDLLRLRRYLR